LEEEPSIPTILIGNKMAKTRPKTLFMESRKTSNESFVGHVVVVVGSGYLSPVVVVVSGVLASFFLLVVVGI
jgi:peptide subunit release factor RF-3